MTTTDQILKILHSHPFSRFSMSQLKPHLQPQKVEDLLTTLSDQEIHEAMFELFQGGDQGIVSDGDHRREDGSVNVRWLSYFGD